MWYLVFEEPPGSYDICPMCYWENDLVQLAFPDMAGGAKHVSLIEAQLNFARVGVSEERLAPHIRLPSKGDAQRCRVDAERRHPADDASDGPRHEIHHAIPALLEEEESPAQASAILCAGLEGL